MHIFDAQLPAKARDDAMPAVSGAMLTSYSFAARDAVHNA